MDTNKYLQAQNWDGSVIKVKVSVQDLYEWTLWDRYNRKSQIHPTQKVFTEADYLPEHLHKRHTQKD